MPTWSDFVTHLGLPELALFLFAVTLIVGINEGRRLTQLWKKIQKK